ncbi:MAG: thiamine phosphate synthase [Planctomycetota bacterium]|nr:thiamine phosphate synthase [Planctomycetota bacterium]
MAGELTAVLITPPAGEPDTILGIAGRALQGGITAIVVRRPEATAREVFEFTRRLRPATRKLGCMLLVSDRADVAVATDADGVHLGYRSLPLAAARRAIKPAMKIGGSAHNLDEVGQLEREGADYLFLSPVFATSSHPDAEPLGLEHYREAVLRASVPVIALGGVTSENVRLVAQAGGHGAAAIDGFYGVEDSAEAARAFRAAFAP